MSFFKKVFSSRKSKDGKGPTPQESIQRLRELEEMLSKKSEFLEKKVEMESTVAKENATKNKRVALAALKRKKRYDKQLQQIDGTLTTIEFQREALENASTNTEVLKAMRSAAAALKSSHQNIDVEKVHGLMDDVAEQQEIGQEISDAISNPVGFGQDVDEDDLLAELEELELEDVDEKLLNLREPIAELPPIPTGKPSVAKAKALPVEDDDLRKLEAWGS